MRTLDMVECASQPWQVPDEVGGLRVAMLGAGRMARLHLATLRDMAGVKLVGVCNRTHATGEALARDFKIERCFQDPAQMISEAKPDAIFVAVSHAATMEMSGLVLRSGIPCLLEKPAGYSPAETRQLADLAREHKCLNMVGLNRRFYSVIHQGLLAVLHQGPISGILVEAHEPILDYRSRRDFDGWLYDNWIVANTIHAIDLLRMIGGEVTGIRGFGKRIHEPRGDSFSAALQFESGLLGTFVSHWNSARGFGLKIYGHGVTAELWPLEQGFVSYDTGRRIKLKPDWSDTGFKAGFYAQNAAFLQAVCDRSAAPFPASDLEDNVKSMLLVEQIVAATNCSAETIAAI